MTTGKTRYYKANKGVGHAIQACRGEVDTNPRSISYEGEEYWTRISYVEWKVRSMLFRLGWMWSRFRGAKTFDIESYEAPKNDTQKHYSDVVNK